MSDQPQEEVVTSYKAFNADLTCTGGDKPFQYEVGKTYEMKGPIKACDRGFHACEYPLNVFDYYPPAGSRFALVEQGGKISREGSDTKLASSRITIKAEIGLAGLIKAAIEYTFSRAKPEGETATGDQGAASATGTRGAASATGDQGAAMACGYAGKAMGALGNALFLVYRDDDYVIRKAAAAIVGENGIKPDTWYSLSAEGEFIEA